MAAAVFSFSLNVGADEFEEFADAKNAFEAGEYETAVERFEALMSSKPENKGLLQEIHKLLAVSYLFVGDKNSAEAHLIELLTFDPDFTLDPLVYPIDVIDFFSEIKARHAERIAALARDRAREEEIRQKEREEQRRQELEKLKRNVYLQKTTERRSLVLAFVPFGAGQFQNGHRVKGALFLSAEILLSAASVTTYIMHERLRPRSEEPFTSSNQRLEYERLEAGYRISNQVIIAALGAVAAAGIIDALYFFERERVEWDPVEEKEVPVDLRPKVSEIILAPVVMDRGAGIGAMGRF
jgi:tetratricopeptide (TPR) repeat protein